MNPLLAPPRLWNSWLPLCVLLSAFHLPSSAFSASDPLIPQRLAADRYKALAARSPFSPPTAEAPPPTPAATPPAPAWGEKYTLGGVAQFGAGYKVTLNPKNPVGAGASASAGGNNVNPTERIVVVTGQPGPDGITLAGVQWGDDPKLTRATLLKNGVAAQFSFDATALATARGNAATASSVPAPRSSASGPGLTAPPSPGGGFPVPAPPPGGGGAPQPGIVRSPTSRAPIRPPPPTGPNGQPLMPPPPPTAQIIRSAPLPAPALPGSAADDDD